MVRDIERAKTYSKTYAERWLKKANEAVEAKATTVAKAAKVANTETIGSLKRTAVTESSEAFSSGRAKYLRRSDALGLLRVWDAGLDSCPICKAADGTIVGAREPFPIGEPGSIHANCCCSWTLLTSAADEQGTLIQPVRPVTVQVPGAASPFAPKGLVPSGGKLVASAETKALARRLDVALGNIAKDGGASARAEVRALLSQHGIKARSLGTGANAIKVTDPADMGGMAGFHEWDGTIRLAPNTIRDSRAALRKIQLGIDPGDDHANALNVLLHEEIHGASAMTKAAFQGPGAALEEAATELVARRISSQLMGREIGAVYADEIAGLKQALNKVSKAKPEALAKRIDEAVSALKSSAPLAKTPAQHIDNFVDALKLTPKQKQALTKQLTETEWWKPGTTAAKKPAAKAGTVKPTKPKAQPKPRGPPKPKADLEATKLAKAEKARQAAEAKATKAKAAAEAKLEKARLAAEEKARKATAKRAKPTKVEAKPKVKRLSKREEFERKKQEAFERERAEWLRKQGANQAQREADFEALKLAGKNRDTTKRPLAETRVEFQNALASGDHEKARSFIREHIAHLFPGSASKDVAWRRTAAGQITIRDIPSAHHHWDGRIELSLKSGADLKKSADLLASGRLDEALAASKPGVEDAAEGLRTFVHEELHGFSRIARSAYRDSGAAIEEIGTELSARYAIAQLSDDAGKALASLKGTSYESEIAEAVGILRRNIPDLSDVGARHMLIRAHSKTMLAPGGEVFAKTHLEDFTNALDGTADQKAEILKGLQGLERK